MKNKVDYNTLASKLFCAAFFSALAYIVLKYALPMAFPLLCAFFISWILSSAAAKISRKTKIPQGVCAFFLVSLLLLAVCLTVYVVLSRLVGQISRLVRGMSDGTWDGIFCCLEKIPFIGVLATDTEEYAKSQLTPLISRALSAISAKVGGIATGAISATPRAIFSGVVYVMCVYYMSVDFCGVCKLLKKLVPKGISEHFRAARKNVLLLCAKLVRAYALIFLITFAELFIGLLILCPRYALAVALCTALLDILPIFGAGVVLLPWSAVSFIMGNTFVGVGLLVLYLVISAVRRIIEPRLVGECVDMHPLASLLCMYAGFKLFGMTGMLILPFAVSLIRKMPERE